MHQVTAVVMTVVMAGCRRGAEPTAGSSVPGPLVGAPVRVVVTTPLLAEIVKRVGLGGVEIDVLVPTGESPAGLQRTGPVESRLVASELAVVLGLGQEEVLAPSLARAVDAGVVVCELGPILPSAQLLEVPGEPGRIDPHVWLDPALWLLAIAPIEEALCRLRPEWAGEFRKQAHAGRFELDEMARVLRRRAQTASRRNSSSFWTSRAVCSSLSCLTHGSRGNKKSRVKHNLPRLSSSIKKGTRPCSRITDRSVC